jgi:hypothetical protein
MSEQNDDTQTTAPDGTVNLNVTTDTEGLFNRLTAWFNEHFSTEEIEEIETVEEEIVANQDNDENEPDNQENQIMANEQITAVTALIEEFGGVDAMRNMLQSAQSVHVNAEAQRTNVIAALVANTRCEFTEEQLNAMDNTALAIVEKLVKPVNYTGQAGGSYQVNADVDEWEYADAPKVEAE